MESDACGESGPDAARTPGAFRLAGPNSANQPLNAADSAPMLRGSFNRAPCLSLSHARSDNFVRSVRKDCMSPRVFESGRSRSLLLTGTWTGIMIWQNLARALRRDPAGGNPDVAQVRALMTQARTIERQRPALAWRHQLLLDALEHQIRDLPAESCNKNCPECGRHMCRLPTENGLAWCDACRGKWVTGDVLKKMTGLSTDIPGRELRHRASQFSCPECSVTMNQFQFCRGTNLMVDACPNNHGIYLQSGELARTLEAARLHVPQQRIPVRTLVGRTPNTHSS